jgi:hypothetical protein
MTHSDLIFIDSRRSKGEALFSEEGRRKLIAISARTGVWGIIVGFVSLLVASSLQGVATMLAGFGFLAGGLGALATSLLVMKDLRRASLPLKLAAILGIPFGMSLVLLMGGTLLHWSLPLWLVSWAVPGTAIMGATIMILLMAGFITLALSGGRFQWED